LIPKAVNLFTDFNDLVSSCLNLNKGLFCGTVQLTSSLNVFNQPSGKQTDADWINFTRL
jgi:hypothetical protein